MVSGGHRPAGVGVAHAEGFEIDLLAVLLDQHHRTGNFAGGDFVIEEIVDARQFFRRENRRFQRSRAGSSARNGRANHDQATAANSAA